MDLKQFSLVFLAKLCVICFLALTLVSSSAPTQKKRCSRLLEKIPVHKNFDLKKFTGTWYTITRSTFAWGKNTFSSFSMDIEENEDGSFQISYTGQIDKKCTPVESGTLEQVKNRPGQYILRVSGQKNNPPTLIISFTDYKDIALVYYCFKYRQGTMKQCHVKGMQVEVISRDQNPDRQNLNEYISRANKRLCITPKQLNPTIPGLCKIPDILDAAKQKELDLKEGESKSDAIDPCAVNNIPVQTNFSSSQLQGLWYEIARTRFTFNKMESVVNFHRYDESNNHIYSYYTGTEVSKDKEDGDAVCNTAIPGMSKTAETAEYDSDRLGKIGGEDSNYPWAPTKVLYADDEYILFYACYSGASDDRCIHEYTEVTLTGRSREISTEKRDAIYSILSKVCVNADDMTKTKFLANCSSWVTIQAGAVKPEDCTLDDITVYDDYVSDQMEGTWYLYSSISYNNMTSLNGVVMEKKQTFSEGIETKMIALSPTTNECTEYVSRSRDICYDAAEHITTFAVGDGNFVFSKVLYLDDTLLVEYTCSARNIEGTCDRNGIQFNVFTKNDTSDEDFILADEIQDVIDKLAESVCLDPNDLQLQTEWCNISAFLAKEMSSGSVDCDLDQIEIFGDMGDFVQKEIYGYWYEVSRSSKSTRSLLTSTVAYFTSPTNKTLSMYFTGITQDIADNSSQPGCSAVQHGSMITRCQTDTIGDFLYRFSETDDYVTYVPFKILYTDYTKVLVTYMCTDILQSGQCSEEGTEVSIWSRNTSLDEEDRLYIVDMVLWKCPEPTMIITPQNNDACLSDLEEYISENQLDKIIEDDYDGGDGGDENDEDDEDKQRDQGQSKTDFSEIEAALLMDDDEFYYGS